MKAEELRRKFKFAITGVTMAAMITSMAACSSQTISASASSETSVETTAAEAEAENRTEDTAFHFWSERFTIS